ncbi:MAG: hypothetical protein CM1200mP38_7440 [Dehalococcoidia bacterium]|nr:MAG: hypothetical protein CM1200mP38_7440 [Dehalococcoidia bacterium]
MLGDKIGEMSGATTNKALPAENGSPKIETAAAGSGIYWVLKGVSSDLQSVVSADGSIYGECPNSGLFMTLKDSIFRQPEQEFLLKMVVQNLRAYIFSSSLSLLIK